MTDEAELLNLTFASLTAERWADLEALFGPRGATGGCWCMWWRLPRAEYERQKGEENRRSLQRLAESGVPLGVIAYVDQNPVGWCAVAPREDSSRLEGSRIMKPVDGQPVWSITCFFVARTFRRRGLMVPLLEAATAFASEHGAQIVEGYPIDPETDRTPDAFAWHGFASAFLQAGFTEVARRSPTRPIMRRTL